MLVTQSVSAVDEVASFLISSCSSPPPCKRPKFDFYCSVIEFVIFLRLGEHLSPVEFPGDSSDFVPCKI